MFTAATQAAARTAIGAAAEADNIAFAMYYPDLPQRPLWAALPATIYLLLYGGLAAAVVVISLLL